jgi:hypothetical protein
VPRHAARPGASARRAARRRLLLVALLVVNNFSSRKLVVDYFTYAARPGASTRVRLVVDYTGSVRRDFLFRPHWLYSSHAVRRDYLSRGNTGSTSSTPCAAVMSSFGRIASTIHLD